MTIVSKEYQRQWRKDHPGKAAEYSRRYKEKNLKKVAEKNRLWRGNNPDYDKGYRKTINGFLRNTYNNIKKRCNNSKNQRHIVYTEKGIRNNFESFGEFRSYIINTLQIDPRGLEIHRVDNNGHYESGNIEFLTPKEHGLRHKVLNETSK